MKSTIFTAFILICFSVSAQWSTTGGLSTSTVTTGGNVGIGTTAPSNIANWNKVLDVHGTTDSKIISTNSSGNQGMGIYSHSQLNGGGGFVGTETNHPLYFITNYNTKMMIGTTGAVGIGTLSPYSNSRLHVKTPSVSDWGIVSEALSNQRIVGLGHDGTAGIVSVSYLDGSGYSPLYLKTSNTTRVSIDVNGNVGIGSTSPGVKLVVQGLGGGNTDLAVNGRIVTGDASNMGGVWIAGAGNMFMGQVSTTSMGWYNNGQWRMVTDNNGNIGIGTLTPNQKLTVNGTIYGKEVKVDLSVPGPDYVFEKSYSLPSLESVESYINQNKHLPEVPSAKEMEANGINLSEMNILLLKKVEELTLYVIELKKEVTELKNNKEK